MSSALGASTACYGLCVTFSNIFIVINIFKSHSVYVYMFGHVLHVVTATCTYMLIPTNVNGACHLMLCFVYMYILTCAIAISDHRLGRVNNYCILIVLYSISVGVCVSECRREGIGIRYSPVYTLPFLNDIPIILIFVFVPTHSWILPLLLLTASLSLSLSPSSPPPSHSSPFSPSLSLSLLLINPPLPHL